MAVPIFYPDPLLPRAARRITAALRRRGWTSNRQRVQRLRREDNLLSLRRQTSAHDRFEPHADGLSELGSRAYSGGAEPALGGRHHLPSAGARVRLPGGRVGRLLGALHGLVAGSPARGAADAGSFAPGPAGRALPPGWGSNIHSGGFYLLAMAQAPRTCYVATQLPGCISTRWDHPAL